MSGEHVAGWRGQNAQRPVEKGLLARELGQSSEWLQGEERVDRSAGFVLAPQASAGEPRQLGLRAEKTQALAWERRIRRWPMP